MHKSPFLVAGLVATIGLAACSSSSKSSTTAATPTVPATAPATTASTSTINVATKAGTGQYLVGSDGHTLYMFEKDTGTTSACTGGCASIWPGLVASAPTAGSGVDATKISTANGQVAGQVVYAGHFLYDFSGDKAAGDINGTKIDGWYPVAPSGAKIGS